MMPLSDYEPLYQKIYNDLREQIQTGILAVGTKVSTEFELMEHYKVSRITAARALKELANNGLIRRMRRNGSIVIDPNHPEDISPIPTASPVLSVYQHIPLVIPFSPDIGFDILGGIEKEAQKHNMLVTMFNTERALDNEAAILKRINGMSIDGMICLPIESHSNIALYTRLLSKGIPIVFVDRKLSYMDVPCVSSDNFNAMYRLTQWLIGKGHRRIGYLSYSFDAYCENQRFKGFIKALMDNGIELDNRYVAGVQRSSGNVAMLPEHDQSISLEIRGFLQSVMGQPDPPTVLMCAFDLLASYVQQQAGQLGIDIPGELSLTGFDNIFISNHLEVPLTTVSQNFDQIGRKAVETLAALQNGHAVPQEYLVDTEIVERQSVRDLRQGAAAVNL